MSFASLRDSWSFSNENESKVRNVLIRSELKIYKKASDEALILPDFVTITIPNMVIHHKHVSSLQKRFLLFQGQI